MTLRPLKVYLHIFYYNFLSLSAYPYELLITVIEPVLEIGFLTLFWSMIAEGANRPVDLVSIVAYFIMAQFISIWAMNPGGLGFVSFAGWRIKTGRISQTLVRPVKILPSLLFEHRGYYCIDMIFSVLLFALAIKLIGAISLSQTLWFIIFLILSFFITFSICVLVSSLAFITKEVSSIRHSVSHVIKILSGGLAPLSFFPDKIHHILDYTPFPSMMYGPINVLQNKLPVNELVSSLEVAVFWAIILFGLALWAWQVNMKKYEAIGI